MDPRPFWLAPDDPADAKPVPWQRRRLSEAGITGAIAAKLQAAGIHRLGDLAAWSDEGILALPGVGPGTLAKLRDACAAWATQATK